MKRLVAIVFAALVIAVVAAGSSTARAGVDVSFGVNVPAGDDGRLFFSISSRYFDREPRVVDGWGRRFADPDDLTVFLYLCSHTRLTPEAVFAYRRNGLSWYDVGVRIGVPVDVWYVPVARDPGPPYGKAYGYWKKHQRDPRYVVRLSDRQARDLVCVRMAHEYYGVSPEVAMDWRRDGRDVRTIMTREYRSRHAHDRYDRDDRYDRHERHGHDDDQGEDHGGGHGRGHGNKHGHGHDKGHGNGNR